MAFALQKRCSTAELSRHGMHRTGARPVIRNSVCILDQPKHQLESVAAAAFAECPTDVAFNRAVADHQALGDSSVLEAFKQQVCYPLLGRSELMDGAGFQA